MAVKSLISFILSGLLFLSAFYTSSAVAKATTAKVKLTVEDCLPGKRKRGLIAECFKLRVATFCANRHDQEVCRGEQRLKLGYIDEDYDSMLKNPQAFFNEWWADIELTIILPQRGGDASKLAALVGYNSLKVRQHEKYFLFVIGRCGNTFNETENQITCADRAGVKCDIGRFDKHSCEIDDDKTLYEHDDELEFSDDRSTVLL